MVFHLRIAVPLCVAAAVVALVPAASAATMRPTSHVVTVDEHAERRISAPSTTRPGLTRVRAVGPVGIQLYQRRTKAGLPTLVTDLDYAMRKNSIAHLQRDFTFTGEIDGGFDGYLPLTRGTYYIVEDIADGRSYRTEDIATVRVTGSRINASAPPSDRIAVAANGTVTPRGMTVHRHYVTLVNAGPMTAVAAVRVGTSVSNAAIRRFLSRPSFSGLHRLGRYPDYRIAQDAPAARSVVLPQFLTPGRYVVIVLRYPHGRLQNTVARRQATSFTLR